MKNFTRLAKVFFTFTFSLSFESWYEQKTTFFSLRSPFLFNKRKSIFAREALTFTPVSEQLDRLKNRSA